MIAERPTKLLTCFPLTEVQIEQIQSVVPKWQLAHADQDNVGQLIMDCDVFCGHGRYGQIDWQRVLERGRLKWIQSSAAGMDHCLVPDVIESDIVVSGCSGLFRDSVAEQALALLYGLVRSMPVFFRAQQTREFIRRPTDDLHGKTIGIPGFGGNGQRIAELLLPLGNRIIATDLLAAEWREVAGMPPIDALLCANELDALLEQSDIVILTLPLNVGTEKFVGRRELNLLRPGSYLINVARGRLVDEEALVEALQSGHLKGAGLDVTWTEPLPVDSPLWTEPQVMITPHVGAQSSGRYQLVVDLLVENLQRFVNARPLKNLVDKSLGFTRPGDRS